MFMSPIMGLTTFIRSLDDLNFCSDIAFQNGLMVALCHHWFSVFDNSDPLAPKLLGQYKNALEGDFWGYIEMMGENYVFALEFASSQTRIYDISNPATPTIIQEHRNWDKTFSMPTNFELYENAIYVAYSGGLKIHDARTRLLGGEALVIRAADVTVANDQAFVVSQQDGLYVFDVSSPVTPRQIGYYPLSTGSAQSVTLVGNLLFVGSSDGGLQILSISGGLQPTDDPVDDAPISQMPPVNHLVRDGIQGKIVYQSATATASQGMPARFVEHELAVLALDGLETRNLTSDTALSYLDMHITSPDGQNILVGSSSEADLRLFSATGELLRTIHNPGKIAIPQSWSSDCQDVLLWIYAPTGATVSNALFRLHLASDEFTQITTDESLYGDASWSSDTRKIVYLTDPSALWIMDADSNNPRLLYSEGHDVSWSPTGEYIAFEGPSVNDGMSGGWDLWIIKPDGTNARNLTNTPDLYEQTPAWSPDGTKIVYQADYLGDYDQTQLYLMDIVTGESTQLTFDGHNRWPQWVGGTPIQTFTIQPPLDYNDHRYEIHYRSGGDFNSRDATELFSPLMANSDWFAGQGITQLWITRDGVLVAEQAEIQSILELYAAAVLLYIAPTVDEPYSFVEGFRHQLHLISSLDAVQAMTDPASVFKTRQSRIEQVLRLMSRPQRPSAATDMMDSIVGGMEEGLDFWEAVDTIGTRFPNAIDRENPTFKRMSQIFSDQNQIGVEVVITSAEATRDIWEALEGERLGANISNLLQQYQVAFGDSAYALDQEQKAAVETIRAEVDSLALQIVQILRDAIVETSVDIGVKHYATSLLEWMIANQGLNASISVSAARVASLGIGVSIGSWLVNLDDLYVHFALAEEAAALLYRFDITADSLVDAVVSSPNWNDVAPYSDRYDGHLAEQFRIAHTLRTLASIQAQRSYADGIEAVARPSVPQLLNPVKWFYGDAWSESVVNYRSLAKFDEERLYDELLERPSTITMLNLALTTGPNGVTDAPLASTSTMTAETDSAVSTDREQSALTGIPTQVYIAVELLNVRSGPTTAFPIIATLNSGTALDVSATSEDGQWLEVVLDDGNSGWVFRDYVSLTPLSDAAPDTSLETPAQTTALTTSCTLEIDSALLAYYNAGELGCAIAAARSVWSAWQPFERGHMLWREDMDRMYILYSRGQWQGFDDTWNGVEIPNHYGVPPSALQTPTRGFGYLWATNDAVFSELGWATDIEKGVCLWSQDFEHGVLMSTGGASCNNGAGDLGLPWLVLLTDGKWRAP